MRTYKIIRSVPDGYYWNAVAHRWEQELNYATKFITVDSMILSKAAQISACEIIDIYVEQEGKEA